MPHAPARNCEASQTVRGVSLSGNGGTPMKHAALALILALIPGTAALAQPVNLTAQLVADGFDLPLFATSPGDGRLFVVEQTGRILLLVDGAVRPEPLLDLRGQVSGGNEQGLLGLALHPDYASNGRFFINYTDTGGDTQIVAYTASGDVADPALATTLLSIDQPYANHNGGWLGFGPDGRLYVGMGDGGSGGDPQGNGQNPDALLGKILRLDVETGGAAPEIFASGVRNPWRPSFDGNDFYIADVGQNAWEEISVISATEPGANLGWNIMEGPVCFGADSCDGAGFVAPVHAYSHADTGGCSITGGYVYRGAEIPEIAGHYFFADYCSGRVESFRYADGAATDLTDWTAQLGGNGPITSFAVDGVGELYYTTTEGGLFRIARAR
ncbi:MAG: glucose dehydrogenase [Hyphomicrobiales bacterium]|nr:MAG: glucose dehydrogenase [Hyphomicrobiales bacterium]